MLPEIDPPPFPKNTLTLPGFLDALRELHAWVLSQREWADLTAAELHAERQLPFDRLHAELRLDNYINMVPLFDMSGAFWAMRKLREDWDKITRFFSDEWGSKSALCNRLRLVSMGLSIVLDCNVTPELKEAREAQQRAELMQRQGEMFKSMFQKLGLSPNSVTVLDPEHLLESLSDDSDDDDSSPPLSAEFFDDLFNPSAEASGDSTPPEDNPPVAD